MITDMLFSRRIQTKQLAGLCRRLAISLGAGVDVRTVWAREAERMAGRVGAAGVRTVSESLRRGDSSLAAALAETGDYFPPLMRDLVYVGERTGHLAEVLTQLAEHYEGQIELRRTFLGVITGPMIQLGLTILIVGFLIWFMGYLSSTRGADADILKIGLRGNDGLAIYAGCVTGCGLFLGLLVWAVSRGLVWTRPIQRAVLRMPGVGKPLRTLALARMTWTLHLTFKTGMEVRHALCLSLRSARNARYTDQIEPVDAEIAAGNSIHEAFVGTGAFPDEFLDALSVAEHSGRVTESMGLLSNQYKEEARAALATLTKLAGVAVWLIIAAIILALIFRLFMFYLGMITDALEF